MLLDSHEIKIRDFWCHFLWHSLEIKCVNSCRFSTMEERRDGCFEEKTDTAKDKQ